MDVTSEDHPRLLLIEDNPGDARLFREILGESGYEVGLRWEEDLAAGLDALSEEQPDVIVADLGLPDSEGPETVERLVEAAPDLPVVVLTGQQTMELALASLEAGATEYLRKDELLPGLVARTLRTAVERKRIEAELRRSRERYRSLFRDSSDAILVHDLEGRVKEANPKAEALFGVGAEELRGRSISSLFAVGEEDTARKKLEALQEGEPYRAVSRYERADGSEFWGELSATATEIGGETVVRTMIRDVTEREEAQKELRQQEAQLRDLANSIPGVLYQFSARPGGTYGFDYLSGGAEELLGLSANLEDFFERGIERVPGSHREELLQSIEKAVQKEEAWEQEISYEKPSGERIWLRAKSSAPEQRGGELVFNGVILDITERKQQEQELAESEARYRAITESAHDAIITIDSDSTIQFANPAVEDIFGYAPAELIGEPLTTLMPKDIREEPLAAVDRFLETGESGIDWSATEFPGLRKDGEEIALSISFSEHERQGEVHFQGIIRDVTERKERERKLRILSEAVEQSSEAILITEGRPLDEPGPSVVYANSAFEEMTGYGTEEILGKTPRVLQGPETEREVLDSLREALEAGEKWEGETTNYRKDGTPFLLQWNVAPITGEEGSVEYWVSVQRDVTDRREREERIRRQKTLLEQTQRLAGGWEVDLRTEEMSWSDKIYEIHEVEPSAEVSVEEGIEFYAPEARPKIREAFERCVEEGEPYDLELPIVTAKGNRRWVRTVGAPAEREEGEVIKVAGAFQDVTARREAQKALRESEERFRGVFENAAIGIALLNEDGELLEINPALQEMTGYDAGELRGSHFEKVTHPEDLEVDKQRYEELAAGKRDRYQMEKRYVRKGGEVFWGRLIVSRHEGREGQVIGMVEDIDEQKHYEEELRAAKEEAEEAAQLKSAMLANMSHEVRTPLTAITGFAEILKGELEGRPKDFADQIYNSGKRLMTTLDSVLELSKLEAGAIELDREPLSLTRRAKETTEMLRLTAEEKSIALETNVADGPIKGEWNEEALRRILEKLVENAIKFTPEGGHVEVRGWEEGEEAVLEVEDTGIGISEEALPEVFEAFKQESEGLGREYEGSGLGLSIVKRLVEAHGGQIDVDTQKGEGTCFTIRLPRAPRDE